MRCAWRGRSSRTSSSPARTRPGPDPAFVAEVVSAAIAEGATTINLPDTVGYTMPTEFQRFLLDLYDRCPELRDVTLSVHCHNDLGLAVANSLAGVQVGARQVEGCINGIGERAGNASIEELVMILRTRARGPRRLWCGIDTTEITRASRLVSRLTGYVVQPNKAIVGRNAFAHEAGIHQHGVLSEPADLRDHGRHQRRPGPELDRAGQALRLDTPWIMRCASWATSWTATS